MHTLGTSTVHSSTERTHPELRCSRLGAKSVTSEKEFPAVRLGSYLRRRAGFTVPQLFTQIPETDLFQKMHWYCSFVSDFYSNKLVTSAVFMSCKLCSICHHTHSHIHSLLSFCSVEMVTIDKQDKSVFISRKPPEEYLFDRLSWESVVWKTPLQCLLRDRHTTHGLKKKKKHLVEQQLSSTVNGQSHCSS